MRVYLAGPMSGIPQKNFPAFDEATAQLRSEGIEVISPAEMSREMGYDEEALVDKEAFGACLTADIQEVLAADALYVLPGWGASKGAKLEVHIAQVCCKPVINYESRTEVIHTVVTDLIV